MLGPDLREVGSGLPLRRAPGKFLPLDLVAAVTLELDEHRTAGLGIPVRHGELPAWWGSPVSVQLLVGDPDRSLGLHGSLLALVRAGLAAATGVTTKRAASAIIIAIVHKSLIDIPLASFRGFDCGSIAPC